MRLSKTLLKTTSYGVMHAALLTKPGPHRLSALFGSKSSRLP